MSTIQQKFIRFFRFWLMLVVLSFATAGCDLWTKHWASQNLSTPTTSGSLTNQRISQHQSETWTRTPDNTKVIVPQYLDLQYAENNAGMFSLGQSQHRPYRRAVLIIGAIVGMVFITHLYAKTAITDPLSRIGLSVLLGGAIGNFVDRIHRGFVVDFIHAHWQGRYHWPTFNVADIAISVGIGLFFLSQLLTAKREQLPLRK